MRSYLRYGNIVAGAAAEGHGILVGWRGHGELTRARVLELIEASGIPVEWAPEPKNPGVQLTRAIEKTSGSLYDAQKVIKQTFKFAKKERRWNSRWLLERRAYMDVHAIGSIERQVDLIATLYLDKDPPELDIESQTPELEAQVRAEYAARISAERYMAADITKWLGDTIRYHLQGIRYGSNFYIPKLHRATAESLCNTFMEGGWGTEWMAPPIPVATTPQMQVGLAMSLQTELGDILKDLFTDREVAVKKGEHDITEKLALNYMMKFRSVGVRMLESEALLGPECFEDCKLDMNDAMIELDRALAGQGGLDFTKEWLSVREQKLHEEETSNGSVQELARDGGQDQLLL